MRGRPTHLVLLAAAALALSLALPRAAEAGRWGFSAHGGFDVGGLGFSVGFHLGHHDPYFRGVPFYRVEGPIAYRGYRCGSACYLDRGSHYHHNACPLVLHHFRRHGYRPQWYPGAYRYGYRYRDGHRYDYRYRRDYRYDRRYRGDRRYDYRDHRGRRYDYRRYDHDSDSDSDGYRRRGAYRTRPRY